jgi:predicted O-methyltransferase YrrM
MNHQLMAIELDPAVVQVAKQYWCDGSADNHGTMAVCQEQWQ